MRIYAFQGITYHRTDGDPAAARGRLAAPPYDQIGEARAAELHAVDSRHFSWLSRPVGGESGDPYREAGRLHAAWLADGTVAADERPTLYPYALELPDGSRRLGITALVGLERPDSGIIRPHEETLAKPLADRLALLDAMEVDLEPVLLLSEDGGELDRLLAEDLAGSRPFASHRDEDGNLHHVHRLGDPKRILRYRTVLGGAPAAIADGHHRYKVALRHAEERGLLGAGGGDTSPPAAATKLAVITSLASPALEIRPIHRAFTDDPGLARAAELAVTREALDVASGRAVADAVAAARQPAVAVHRHGERPEIWRLDPQGAGTRDLSPGARQLAVALLHASLFPAMGLPAEAASDGTTLYRPDPEVVWRGISAGELAAGVYLPPMEPRQFAAAIAGGDMLPPKSTRFLPKVTSGLVWASHDARLA